MNDTADIFSVISAISNPLSVQDNWNCIVNSTSNTTTTSSNQPQSLIAGKMISVVEEIDLQVWEAKDPKQIKMAMVSKIAEQLINSKMVEFTSQHDPMGLKVKIRARLFVTPDDQVRILREAGY